MQLQGHSRQLHRLVVRRWLQTARFVVAPLGAWRCFIRAHELIDILVAVVHVASDGNGLSLAMSLLVCVLSSVDVAPLTSDASRGRMERRHESVRICRVAMDSLLICSKHILRALKRILFYDDTLVGLASASLHLFKCHGVHFGLLSGECTRLSTLQSWLRVRQ